MQCNKYREINFQQQISVCNKGASRSMKYLVPTENGRSEILTTMTMKITVFWIVTPCSVVEHSNVSAEASALNFSALLYHEDGGRKFIRNNFNVLPDYTVSYPRRQCLRRTVSEIYLFAPMKSIFSLSRVEIRLTL
jgi:hypothetical protein